MVLALGTAVEPQAKDYSLGVPEARTALLMEELDRSLKEMIDIDAALNQMLYGRCQSQWAAVAERNSTSNRKRFSECFAEAAPSSYELRTRNIGSYEDALAVYARSLEQYSESKTTLVARQDDISSTLRARLEATRIDQATDLNKLVALRTEVRTALELLMTDRENVVGRIVSLRRGRHELVRQGVRRELMEGDEIHLLDRIETGPNGSVRVQLYDAGLHEDGKRTNLRLANDTSVSLTKWVISADDTRAKLEELERHGAIELIKGAIRFFSKNWGSRSSFSVRTGTSLCGIRGTEFDVIHDPDQDSTLYRLHSGSIEIQPHISRSERVTLSAGRQLRVIEGVAQTSEPLGARAQPQ